MSDPHPLRNIWRLIIETEQLSDGTWRAWSPSGGLSATGATEQEARDIAVDEAIARGENPDELVRRAHRKPVELEPDDPRVGWVWRFAPQTEQFGDGTWRAWFASGGWVVTASSEAEAREKANLEWFRRREEPDEIARRIAMMRRHLVEPVPGVENFDSAVLEPAWRSDNPRRAVGSIIEQLGRKPPAPEGGSAPTVEKAPES